MRILLISVFLVCLSLLIHAQSVELELVASGFSSPVDIQHAGDGRLFIVEQRGTIRIIDENQEVLNDFFLDIRASVSAGGERGLLGLAFHPQYDENGYFFVNYTGNDGDTRVSRFTRSGADPNLADASSEAQIIEIDQPFGNHNGGGIAFGPDGYLYIGMGDGGNANDPFRNGQDPMSLLSKMLRIDVDTGMPYSIPEDNPYARDDFTADEIWAFGLRNPWRFSFDRMTGDLYMGDVGQNEWEEINFQEASSGGGENYGWRCYEANQPYFSDDECPDAQDLTFPIHAISHVQSNDCSVTGGYVYRGCEWSYFFGKYIYGDYCSGQMYYLYRNESDEWVNEELIDVTNFQLSTFGEDFTGELYLAYLGQGRVYRINDICFSNPPPAPPISYDGTFVVTDDEYDSYDWHRDGGLIAMDSSRYFVTESGAYHVVVKDDGGCVLSSDTIDVFILPSNKLSFDYRLSIYPSIFNNHLAIETSLKGGHLPLVRIFDNVGRQVFEYELRQANESLNVTGLGNGIYFAHFSLKGKHLQTVKLIKH